ncbi:hypothetical protein DPMN_161809 [Dreissena polymorpha]|uniref:Uncharacterized protein n=1 Tax=Dreissena polymorpha TaxID=45954 RepID=A0A9D4ISZ1_DREPO|nr:hypothetical protein DPMN_161809 [Dreissena polymorpha]
MNLLTKCHEDRTVNVASRPFFQANIIIFELIPDIIETNILTKFHEDWTIIEKCPAPGGHVFKATKTIFELIQDIISPNLLTKFHDDRKINVTHIRKIAPPSWWPYRTINVASRVLTKFYYSLTKPYKPRDSHVFQANVTIFKLIQDIIKTNCLTIFHQDWPINVASRVLTRKNALSPGSHVF